MNLTEKTLSSTTIFNGKILTLITDDILLPNGKNASREVVLHNGGCCVLALTPNDEVLLVKQFRYPIKEVIYEIPAGKLNHGEDPYTCALRELEEETGYCASSLEDWGQIYPTPGYCAEKIYLYFADSLTFTAQNLDEDEFLGCEAVPFLTALDMVSRNEIKDAKTVIALLKLALAKNK